MDRNVASALIAAAFVGLGLNACTTTTDGGGAAQAPASGGGPVAYAQLKDAAGALKGRAVARPMRDGVHVDATVENMAPGTYAIHVHQDGVCAPPDFASAGPHWNPAGRQHGKDNPAGPHKGDLPNVTVGANGRGAVSMHISGVTMTGEDAAPNALLDPDGAAVVLHAGVDDYRTDPSGNAGGRVACGAFSAGS